MLKHRNKQKKKGIFFLLKNGKMNMNSKIINLDLLNLNLRKTNRIKYLIYNIKNI